MKPLLTILTVLFSSISLNTIHAQNVNKIDKSNNTYHQQKRYLDSNGNPYYTDSNGNPYYIDSNGNPYYNDNNGNPFYTDGNGDPYYIDTNGNPYYIDTNGNRFYRNEDKKVNNEKYNDDVYKRATSRRNRSGNYTNRQSYQEKNLSKESFSRSYNDFDKFRLALGGGYAFRLGEREKSSYPEVDQASKDLMHGFNLDADIQFFFRNDMGIGATFNYLQTSTSLYDDKQTFIYIGPSFIGKSDFNNSFSLIYNIGVGPLFFKESSNVDYDFSKTTFGINGGISGEYRISQNVGIGLKIYYIFGSIGSINYNGNNYDLDKRQSVSSIGFTGFISFRAK